MNEDLFNIIKNGGIAVIPTDTVYGIVCDALNEESVRRIYEIKNRDYSKAMIVLVSDFEMLNKFVADISDVEQRLINNFWPGPLTIIFKKKNIPDIVTANKEEIGIRMPNDEKLLELIKKIGKPIVATSANISSQETITNVSMLEDKIKYTVDYICDAGTIVNESSTIIKILDNKVKIIREGILSEKIKKYFDCF